MPDMPALSRRATFTALSASALAALTRTAHAERPADIGPFRDVCFLTPQSIQGPYYRDPRLVRAQIKRLGTFPVQLEGNLLEIQDDVGGVFDYAGDRLKLVQYAFDLYGGYGRAFNRRKQRAPQRVADGGAEAALKRLSAELAVLLGERLRIHCKTFRFLESSPKHICVPLHARRREAFCYGRACFSSLNESVLTLVSSVALGFGKLHETRFDGGSRPGHA